MIYQVKQLNTRTVVLCLMPRELTPPPSPLSSGSVANMNICQYLTTLLDIMNMLESRPQSTCNSAF